MNYAEHPSIKITLEGCTIKTRHLRDENGTPWGTVVVIEGSNFTVIGASSCHRRDTFSKKMGRTLAEGRAMRGMAVRLGLAKANPNPMVLELDRALNEWERPIIETTYSKPDRQYHQGRKNPDTPSRSIVLITDKPSVEEE